MGGPEDIEASYLPRQRLAADQSDDGRSPAVELIATVLSFILLILTFPVTIWACFKIVQEYERAVIFRLGRIKKGGARGPGIFFVLPCTDSYANIDLRTISFDVPPQEVLTKDSVTVTVDAVVYYKVSDPLRAVISISDYSRSTRLLAATTLRNVLGTRNLAETLSDRENISHQMQSVLDTATDPWGVKVERVEIGVKTNFTQVATTSSVDYISILYCVLQEPNIFVVGNRFNRFMAQELFLRTTPQIKILNKMVTINTSNMNRSSIHSGTHFGSLIRRVSDPVKKTLSAQQAHKEQLGEDDDGINPVVQYIVIAISFFLLALTFPFTIWACFNVVQEYERAVIFRLGRIKKGGVSGPGIFFVLPCTDSYTNIDLRTISFDVPPQEILTKDSVTVSVDAVVYYKVSDPLKAVVSITNYSASTQLLAATTLRNVLGTRNLAETLSDRENISHQMQGALDFATEPWGVKVERVEIKDVRLPVQLQRAMAAEAEASREARAKVIAAEGEMKASRALKEAADVIGASPAALQLRYLQTLTQISAEKNSTIIFPLPMDIVTAFLPKNRP